MSDLINQASEKITEEVYKLDTPESAVLGNYIKTALLTSDVNAVKILEANKDLCTFIDRLKDIAGSINRNEYKDKDISEITELMGKTILGIEDDETSERPVQFNENTIKAIKALTGGKNKSACVCVTSELILPLLHIYLDIDTDSIPQFGMTAPKTEKRPSFKKITLDD